MGSFRLCVSFDITYYFLKGELGELILRVRFRDRTLLCSDASLKVCRLNMLI